MFQLAYTTKALYSSEVAIMRKMSVLHILSSEVLCACFSRSFHMHKAERGQPLRVNFKEQENQKGTQHLEYDTYFFQ